MRTSFPKLRWIAAMALVSAPAFAADLSLDNINLADYEALVQEFSANSQYSSVTPASSLGGLWGFEFGVVGGMTKAPDLLALVKRNNAGANFKDELYHVGGLARLGLPFGFTAEALYFPKTTISSIKIGRWGGAAQWTLTDAILEDFPIELAIKGYVTKTTLQYSQTVNNASTANVPVNAVVGFDNTLYGFQVIASYKLFIFEPYVGLGWMKAKGDLNVDASGNTTILNIGAFGSSKSASSKPSSAQVLLGTDLRLAFFSLGAEYERAFKKNSYTGRVSFRF